MHTFHLDTACCTKHTATLLHSGNSGGRAETSTSLRSHTHTIAYDRHCADVGKDHHHDNICVTHTQPQPPELTLKVGNLLLHADFLRGWIGELDKQGPKSRHIGEQAGTGQIIPEMQQQPMIALVVNEATSQCALWGSTANVGLGSQVHI